MRFCSRIFLKDAPRRRLAMSILVCASLTLCVASPAFAQRRKGGNAPPTATSPPAETPPPGKPLTKSQAVFALIQALAVNQSDAAREALEQIVVGTMPFGAHNQQAAETALVALAMRPSPEAAAFLLRILSEPDEKLRPGDAAYPAAALRYDAVRVAGKVGSPELRLGLAKLHDRASPEIRTAIETALSKPSAANFAAQVVLVRSRSITDVLRTSLEKMILDQNASALKQALKIAGDAPAQNAAAGPAELFAEIAKLSGAANSGVGNPAAGSPATPAPGAPAGSPLGGLLPSTTAGTAPMRAAAAEALQNPVALILDISEKAINAMPADPAVVARELWQSEFVESLAAQLSTQKTNPELLLTGVGSIPLKTARERLRDYLLQKGPQELGKLARPAPAAPAAVGGLPGGPAMGRGPGGRGMGSRGTGGRPTGTPAAQGPAFVVGADWLDPGTVVVLKTLSYKDRPKAKHRSASPPYGVPQAKRSAAAEKRAEELADKQKLTETQYEWRDTIEKFVSHWDDRLSAVAESHEAADTDSDAAAGAKDKADAKEKQDQPLDKSKSGSTKSTGPTDPASKKTGRTAEKKSSSEPKAKGSSAAPTPAVPLPFALRPGEKITKEFHLRWPEDLPATLTATVSEPLVVHYVQLEGSDDINRAATFYRGALSKGAGTRSQSAIHDTPDGKWVDIVQRDLNGQRTRSLDILVTRQPPDPETKKSKVEELTVQVLMVEVESFEPESKQGDKKEQAKSEQP